MIKYRIANSEDAENLLKTRYNAVVNCNTTKYPTTILHAWAPKINDESILAEKIALKDPDRITIVAEDYKDDGKIQMVGFCTLILSKALETQGYVIPEYTRKGIGSELKNKIEIIAKNNGLNKLTISSSLIGFEFQKKNGYKPLYHYEYNLGDGLTMECVMMEKSLYNSTNNYWEKCKKRLKIF
ncbi:MAG: GNAT family N-acetyltransferase [Candidatus Azobacteroides sp.]|nr:GNAT family N-acetyltransferase [Candidatus Azobacteroides sp.]